MRRKKACFDRTNNIIAQNVRRSHERDIIFPYVGESTPAPKMTAKEFALKVRDSVRKVMAKHEERRELSKFLQGAMEYGRS
jgi:hypothetical protein